MKKIDFPAKPPKNEADLLNRCGEIAGKSFQELASYARVQAPQKLLNAKGWVGQLLELFLGTTAGNKSEPDFTELGIELKSIPIDMNGKPKETTYVSVVPLIHNTYLQWRQSIVYQKLKRVLWIPVQADPNIPVTERRIGMGAIWSPSSEQENVLQQDWEEHMEKIVTGNIDSITAHAGQYLQIRPKAANRLAKTTGIAISGHRYQTLPRGFYLRTSFTRDIISQLYD